MFQLEGSRPHVRRAIALGISCAVAVAWVASSPRANAQRYQEIPLKMTENEARAKRGAVTGVLRTPTSLSDQQKKEVEQYLMDYYFPSMTQTDPQSLAELADKREKFASQFLDATSKAPEVRKYLSGLAMRAMGQIALGNYHPAARYNAILLMGRLDAKPAEGGNPPTPSPTATNALILVLTKDEIKNIPVPISAKVGALVGLERHARFGIDEQLAGQVTQAALSLINEQEKPEDVSRGVHHWMQGQAARVLVNQFRDQPTAELQQAVGSLIASDELSLDDRCSAANLLAKPNYANAGDLDLEPTVLAVGRLARAVLAKEAKSAQKYLQEIIKEGGFGGRGGGYGGGEFGRGGYGGELGGRGGFGGGPIDLNSIGMQREQGPKLEKRRMLARLKAVSNAAGSLGAASADTKTKLDAIAAPINDLIDTASDKDANEIAVAEAVVDLAGLVGEAVAQWEPEPVEPAEEAPAAAAFDAPADGASAEGDAAAEAAPPADAAAPQQPAAEQP